MEAIHLVGFAIKDIVYVLLGFAIVATVAVVDCGCRSASEGSFVWCYRDFACRSASRGDFGADLVAATVFERILLAERNVLSRVLFVIINQVRGCFFCLLF